MIATLLLLTLVVPALVGYKAAADTDLVVGTLVGFATFVLLWLVLFIGGAVGGVIEIENTPKKVYVVNQQEC